MDILPYTLCKFNPALSDGELETYQYPFKRGEHVLFISEITNMPGHCIISTKDGQVHFGYHTDDFVELTDEEI